jgi:hypothetical protein
MDPDSTLCSDCGGFGDIEDWRSDGNNNYLYLLPCTICGGGGVVAPAREAWNKARAEFIARPKPHSHVKRAWASIVLSPIVAAFATDAIGLGFGPLLLVSLVGGWAVYWKINADIQVRNWNALQHSPDGSC